MTANRFQLRCLRSPSFWEMRFSAACVATDNAEIQNRITQVNCTSAFRWWTAASSQPRLRAGRTPIWCLGAMSAWDILIVDLRGAASSWIVEPMSANSSFPCYYLPTFFSLLANTNIPPILARTRCTQNAPISLQLP